MTSRPEWACGFPATPGEDRTRRSAVCSHIERTVGPVERVLHEGSDNGLHLDVLYVPSSAERPYVTVSTVGMSQAKMAVPQAEKLTGMPDLVELLLLLPPDWPMRDPAYQWPFTFLAWLGRVPTVHDTWYGPTHVIPAGSPPQPLAPGSELAGAMIVPPVMLREDVVRLVQPGGKVVVFYGVVFLTADELDYKAQHGAEALVQLLDGAGVSELVEPGRSSVVPSATAGRGWSPTGFFRRR